MLRRHHPHHPAAADDTRRHRWATRLGRLTGSVVALVVLAPAVATAMPIEGYSSYEPQKICSPNAKPGTLKLAQWLQRTFPGSGSLGISRSCKDGGVSEHKEGRAFDWAVNVGSARDRGYVSKFFARVFATDAEGNKHALARRMGIMYMIWNDHIYSAYYGFRARDYRPCKVLSQCSATMRHRNHVHISLSKLGGAGKTSWYTGGSTVPPAPKPAPKPAPEPPAPKPTTPAPAPAKPKPPADGTVDLNTRPYVALRVAANGTTRTSGFKLRKGTAYKVTAGGVYGYGGPAAVADASCRWSTSGRWTPYPTRAVAKRHGSLNLLVNGVRMAQNTCRANHTYSRVIRPRSTGPLKLKVANIRRDASGSLTVVVSRTTTNVSRALPKPPVLAAAPRTTTTQSGYGLVTETVSVPAASSRVLTRQSVQLGATYRVTTSGNARLGVGVSTDGRCLSVAGRWYPRASLDRTRPAADHGDLYVDGVPFNGRQASGSSACASRTHVANVTARRTGRLELAVYDPWTRRDNSGALTVRVQRVTPVATPAAAPAGTPGRTRPWTQGSDVVRVNAAVSAGAVSTMRLRKGETIDVHVEGTQRSDSVTADGACVRSGTRWVDRDPSVLLGQDALELWVDGTDVRWRPIGSTAGCSARHAYSARFTATKNGPLRLAVLDLDHRDNTGTLEVTLLRD